MPWLLIAELAAGLIAALGIGWPWGAVAAAGCLALPVLAVLVVHRLSVPRVWRARRLEPLRVTAVRLAPEVPARKAIPGTAEDVTRG